MSESHLQTLLIIQAGHNALCSTNPRWSSRRGSRGGASWPWSGVQQWWICRGVTDKWYVHIAILAVLRSLEQEITANKKRMANSDTMVRNTFCVWWSWESRDPIKSLFFLRIDFGKLSFQVVMKYPVYLHHFFFFFLSWVHLTSQHDQGRKCTHNRHCLAVKRQLSSLTVAEIALGYVWALYAIQWLGLSAGGDGRKWVGPNGHAACSCRGILGLLKTRATCQNHSMAKQIKRKEICPSALVWRLFLLFAAMWFDLRPGTAYTSRGKLKKDTARRLTRYMSRGKPKKDASRCLEHCTLQEES